MPPNPHIQLLPEVGRYESYNGFKIVVSQSHAAYAEILFSCMKVAININSVYNVSRVTRICIFANGWSRDCYVQVSFPSKTLAENSNLLRTVICWIEKDDTISATILIPFLECTKIKVDEEPCDISLLESEYRRLLTHVHMHTGLVPAPDNFNDSEEYYIMEINEISLQFALPSLHFVLPSPLLQSPCGRIPRTLPLIDMVTRLTLLITHKELDVAKAKDKVKSILKAIGRHACTVLPNLPSSDLKKFLFDLSRLGSQFMWMGEIWTFVGITQSYWVIGQAQTLHWEDRDWLIYDLKLRGKWPHKAGLLPAN